MTSGLATGVSIVRVHDVAEMVDVVKVSNAIKRKIMKKDWPNREERENFEIGEFVIFYKKLPSGKSFKVVGRGDLQCAGPDYLVQDGKMDEYFGVELMSVYLDDRSVPDFHMKVIDGNEEIPYETDKIDEYEKQLLKAVAEKIRKAKGYDQRFPLILSVYVNEYISIFMDERKFQWLVDANEDLFDRMAPFSEIVFWPLPNGRVFSVKP